MREPLTLFGIGAAFARMLIERVVETLSTKRFWSEFTKVKSISHLSGQFKDDQPVSLKGDPNLVDIYLGSYQKQGREDFVRSTSSEKTFKEISLDELFETDFDVDSYSKILISAEYSGCCLDRTKISGRSSPSLVPFFASYLGIVASRCPAFGKCSNTQKDSCARYISRTLESVVTKLKTVVTCGVYFPTHFEGRGSGELAWSNFKEIKTDTKFEAAELITEREIFGSSYLPSSYSVTGGFYSVFDGISKSLVASDIWFELVNRGEIEKCYEPLRNALPSSIWTHFQSIVEFFIQNSELADKALLQSFLTVAVLERSKGRMREAVGIRIDPYASISSSSAIVTRRNLEAFKSMEAHVQTRKELERAIQLLITRDIGLSALSDIEFVLSDGSKISGREFVRNYGDIVRTENCVDYRKVTLLDALVLSQREHDVSMKPAILVQYYILCRAGVLDPCEIVLRDPGDLEHLRFVDMIRDLSSPKTYQIVTNDFSKYLDAEDKVNKALWSLGPDSLCLPTNRDVYTLLKGIVSGRKELVCENLRHLWRDRRKYDRVVILVFDGLGYLLLSWLSESLPRLWNLVKSERHTAVATSCLPSLTAVNHTALLAAETINEDYFIDRSATFRKYLDNLDGTKSLIKGDRAVLIYAEDGEFISLHGPNSTHLSKAISRGYKTYTKPDSHIGAISRALGSSHRTCLSQVNIFDRYLEGYQPHHFASSYEEYLNYSTEFCRNAFRTIDENIRPGTCIVLVADHGLGWWRSSCVKRPDELADRIAQCFTSGSIRTGGNHTDAITICRGQQEVALMIPPSGPRRVASVFPYRDEDHDLLLKSIPSDLFGDEFQVRKVVDRKSHEPSVVLVSRTNVITRVKPDENQSGGYIVGMHGGISVQELLVPVIVFDSEDWLKGD